MRSLRPPRTRPPAKAGTAVLSAAVAVLALLLGALVLAPQSASAATTSLCAEQTASVAGGGYIVQNNEYDSSATECVSTDGGADFSVTSSGIANSTSGSPGAYPSIYQGCHWGACSSGGLSSDPIEVSNLAAGQVTTSWSTSQPGGSNAYDVAYDIWFNKTATTTGQPNCTEVMVWLNHDGSVQPFGSTVASGVNVGGTTYNVWEGAQSTWDTVTYDMTSPATSVSNLDLYPIARDAVSRGYLSASCYLIDVEAGFELWQGGAGLATNSFSVNVNGSGGASSPPTASASPTSNPTTPAGGGAGCTAAYTLTNSWSGGFQGQVTVTAGSSPISGWNVGWTYPAAETINDLWNGSYTQSGDAVSVSNLNYNGSLAAGSSTTFGFTGTDTGSDAAPGTLSCTASG
jgi:cellulose 1,4-beta-cellobiosidase